MYEVGPQQRFASHVGKHATSGAVEPVNGAFRRVLGHALHFVVEGPAVMAVEIAFKFGEQVRDERMKVSGCDTGADVGEQPPLHRVIDLASCPLAFFWWMPVIALL